MRLPIIEQNKQDCASGCNAIPEGFVEAPQTNADKKLDFMRERTESMGYRFVGRHSAIKVCNWTKKSVTNQDVCYKKKFYGIESHQCVQMTPVMFFCSFNCLHCWRNFDYMMPREHEQWDDPQEIIEGCIDAHLRMLTGFGGNPKADPEKFKAAQSPKHFAISLSGEPTMYPHLPEFIGGLNDRKMTSYLVTNGTYPEMIEKLIQNQPTNLYLSFYGTDPKMYKKTAVPMLPDYWERIQKTFSLFGKFDCNTVMRLTLSKGLNFEDPKGYAKFADQYEPRHIEVKAFMAVGGSRKHMDYGDMPAHDEIVDFASEIERNSSYHIVDEKPNSRVVLLAR